MTRLAWFLHAVWAVLSVTVLARFVYEAPLDSTGEIRVRFVLETLAVNFPLSALLMLVTPTEEPLWQWCYFTLGGFVQWVLIVPWLIGWTRRTLPRLWRRKQT
ncbi:MAG TPA: hypothetical protein VE685_14930 [Thermoanaerobaculia bacterium]|nr:hypothetical protein [Thermoanaerobaculia bacterium]